MTIVVDIPVPAGRVPNLAWKKHGYCPMCEDTGYVIVTVRIDRRIVKINGEHRELRGGPFEEMGPCPKCARGFCVEFAYGRKTVQRGKAFVVQCVQGTPLWGRDGYWIRHQEQLATIESPSWSALIDTPSPAGPVQTVLEEREEFAFDD